MSADLPAPPPPRRPASQPATPPGHSLVGVIGGMGPLATVEFCRRVIAATPADRDQDHVPLLVWNDPRIPDRSDALTGAGADPTAAIRSAARSLITLGVSKLVVPCNTAHAFLDRALDGIDIPLISLVDRTVAAAERRATGTTSVAVLGTDGTVASGLYHRALAAAGIRVAALSDAQQRSVMHAIRLVKGSRVAEAQRILCELVCALEALGTNTVIAACTELPIALGTSGSVDTVGGVEVLDPMGIAAEEIVRQHTAEIVASRTAPLTAGGALRPASR